MTNRGWVLLPALLACGPSSTEVSSSGGVGQSDSSVEPKLDVPDDGTSSGGDLCSEVVDGDVLVNEESDFAWLATVREIRGGLTIAELSGHEDLSFLGCLESVQGMWVRDTVSLLSLNGLGKLKAIGGGFSVSGNQSLETLDGLDAVEVIGEIWILDNPALSKLEIETPREIGYFRLGWYECEFPGPVTIPRGDNPKLTQIDGFGRVEKAGGFVIQGQSALRSVATIAGIVSRIDAAGGWVSPLHFHLNPSLPRREIEAVWEARGSNLDDASLESVCENQGDKNQCPCEVGE